MVIYLMSKFAFEAWWSEEFGNKEAAKIAYDSAVPLVSFEGWFRANSIMDFATANAAWVRAISDKWAWKMDFCRSRGLPPANSHFWDLAEREFDRREIILDAIFEIKLGEISTDSLAVFESMGFLIILDEIGILKWNKNALLKLNLKQLERVVEL